MVLVDEHNSALPYSHAEWAHSNLGHYQVAHDGDDDGDDDGDGDGNDQCHLVSK